MSQYRHDSWFPTEYRMFIRTDRATVFSTLQQVTNATTSQHVSRNVGSDNFLALKLCRFWNSYRRGGGWIPWLPVGGWIPRVPGGGWIPWLPVGGWIPWLPVGGWIPWLPGGGWIPWLPGGGWIPWLPGGGWIPCLPVEGWIPWIPRGGSCRLWSPGTWRCSAPWYEHQHPRLTM